MRSCLGDGRLWKQKRQAIFLPANLRLNVEISTLFLPTQASLPYQHVTKTLVSQEQIHMQRESSLDISEVARVWYLAHIISLPSTPVRYPDLAGKKYPMG